MRTICICNNCGERTNYPIEPKICPVNCSNCSTAEKRRNVVEENLEIKKNREKITA